MYRVFLRAVTPFIVIIFVVFHSFSSFGAESEPYGPQEKRFGAGIIVGEPTGLALKGYVTPEFAIDGIVSWSFVDDALTLIGDLTYEFFDIPTSDLKFTLPFYAGGGVKIGFDRRGKKSKRKTIVGIRIPVGVAMHFSTYPIEIFVELAPGIEVAPKSAFDFTGGIGARFYFF